MSTTYYTLKEAAPRIGVSVGTLKRLAWNGKLDGAAKDGTAWMVPARTVARLEQMGRVNVLAALRQVLASKRPAKAAVAAPPAPAPAAPPPAKPPAKKGTQKAQNPASKGNQHIILVMDESSSMHPALVSAAERYATKALEQMTGELQNAGFDVDVSTYTFSGTLRPKTWREPGHKPHQSPKLDTSKCTGTALNDAIGQALKKSMGNERKDESVLLLVLTDGGENQSKEFHRSDTSKLRNLISQAQSTQRYTITVAGPEGIDYYAKSIGLEDGNTVVWDQSVKGVEQLGTQTQVATSSYTAARASGKRAVNNFFRPDLSKVTAADLAKLADLSDHFKPMKVEKESRVDKFIAEKTKEPLVIGSVYYQLMKREKVQSHKGVLVRRIGEKRIYGGAQARRLLGLPKHEVTVEPGNHAGYEIFVQSTSINRRLPRGTTVLWDKTQRTAMTPTWDHTAL